MLDKCCNQKWCRLMNDTRRKHRPHRPKWLGVGTMVPALTCSPLRRCENCAVSSDGHVSATADCEVTSTDLLQGIVLCDVVEKRPNSVCGLGNWGKRIRDCMKSAGIHVSLVPDESARIEKKKLLKRKTINSVSNIPTPT